MTDRERFDEMAAAERVQMREEFADRYLDLRVAVEIGDAKSLRAAEDEDGMVEVYGIPAADWNRIVAVARGHVSQSARRTIDKYKDHAWKEASRAKD